MVWIAIALMTGVAVLCVVWPLSKPRADVWRPEAGDLPFYRDQMRAIDTEIAVGLVAPTDAAGSRAEIGRRLIAAADRAGAVAPAPGRRRRLMGAAVASMVLVPAVSLGLYLRLGAPDQRDLPLAARLAMPDDRDVDAMIAKVETHLASHPEDGRGFDLLAPLYLRLGRYDDAVRTFERSLALQGESVERRTGYGQALTFQADGVVTAAARAAFDAAVRDDAQAPQPQFFLGLAALQDGDPARARRTWTAVLATAPTDAPWRPMVESRLAALDGKAGPVATEAAAVSGPASMAGAAIAALPTDRRGQAIRGMVDGLAARLAQDGRDRDGWLKLIRAYAVLGDRGKASGAVTDARRNLSTDPQGLAQVDGLARELGLEG